MLKKIQEGIVLGVKRREVEEKDINEAKMVINSFMRNIYINEQFRSFFKKAIKYNNNNNKAMYKEFNRVLNKNGKTLFDYNKKGMALNLFDESGKWVYGIKIYKNKLYVSENGIVVTNVHIS